VVKHVRSTVLLGLGLSGFLAFGTRAAAQDDYVPRTRLNIRTGYDTERKDWVLGAGVRIAAGGKIEVIPSIDYYFNSVITQWQGNLDVALRVDKRGLFYIGTGAAILNAKNVTWVRDFGWNIFAGIHLEPEGSNFGLFAEPRWTFGQNFNPFYFALGFTLAL